MNKFKTMESYSSTKTNTNITGASKEVAEQMNYILFLSVVQRMPLLYSTDESILPINLKLVVDDCSDLSKVSPSITNTENILKIVENTSEMSICSSSRNLAEAKIATVSLLDKLTSESQKLILLVEQFTSHLSDKDYLLNEGRKLKELSTDNSLDQIIESNYIPHDSVLRYFDNIERISSISASLLLQCTEGKQTIRDNEVLIKKWTERENFVELLKKFKWIPLK